MSTDPPITLASLSDAAVTQGRLTAGGLPPAAARAKAALFARSAEALLSAGLGADFPVPVRAFFVPGRIEVLGKHTDYAGGSSIVTATEQGFCLVAAPRDDTEVHAFAVDFDDRATFPLTADAAPQQGHWSNYPMTVARRVAKNFSGDLRGAYVAFAGDLPPASGMSSSSALVVGFFLAISAINQLAQRDEYRDNIDSPESLAEYLGTVENGQSFAALAGDRGVGTFGGSEDHTAILCCRAGMLSQYAYCPVRLERRIPLPEGWVFAIASSGVVAEKTGQAMARYNRASRLATAVAEQWRKATGRDDPHIAAALAGDDWLATSHRMLDILLKAPADGEFRPRELAGRFEHFIMENQQTLPHVGDLLADGSDGIMHVGSSVDHSQKYAELLLGNQVPETIFLARVARGLGAAAASAFGAGFGGSVWALETEDRAPRLLEQWRRAYEQEFPEPAARAAFFTTRPAPAAFELT